MNPCPLCDQTFPDQHTLTKHIVGEHAEDCTWPKADSNLWFCLDPEPMSFCCVCGQAFRFTWERKGLVCYLQVPDRLLRHIESAGGWAAHLLNTQGKKRRS